MELQFGIYNGEVADNKPHGKGNVTFYPDDLGGRKVFDGTWVNGRRDGPGKMTWTTGEVRSIRTFLLHVRYFNIMWRNLNWRKTESVAVL